MKLFWFFIVFGVFSHAQSMDEFHLIFSNVETNFVSLKKVVDNDDVYDEGRLKLNIEKQFSMFPNKARRRKENFAPPKFNLMIETYRYGISFQNYQNELNLCQPLDKGISRNLNSGKVFVGYIFDNLINTIYSEVKSKL